MGDESLDAMPLIATIADGMGYFYEIFVFCFCILPVTSSVVLSVYLFRLVRRTRKVTVIDGMKIPTPAFSEKLKSLAFIFATTAWTAISLLPFRFWYLCSLFLLDYDNMSCTTAQAINWLEWSLYYLIALNP
ncbi:Protein AEXR-1, partial [Aphelenchoides avenae]